MLLQLSVAVVSDVGKGISIKVSGEYYKGERKWTVDEVSKGLNDVKTNVQYRHWDKQEM